MRPRRAGMTLIEVLGGLALLAAVLGGELAVKSRCTRQARVVAQRREALRAADELLAAWSQSLDAFPRNASGRVETTPELQWHTRRLANAPIERLGGQVVRLEIRSVAGEPGQTPLVEVEVVLPSQGAAR